jgi:HemY protein
VLLLLSAVAVLALFCVIFYLLVYLIIHTPQRWKRTQLAKRQMLGLEALTETFAAIATYDAMLAHKKLLLAQKYLPHQPLTLMLSAQVARISGNEKDSRLYIEQMLQHDVTEFIALRSLIEKTKNSNDFTLAIHHAEKALAIKASDNWLIATLSELYAKSGRMQDALHLLESSLRKRYINRDFFRRESAYTLYENAKFLLEQQRGEPATYALEESLRRLPDFTAASVLLAETHIARNNLKAALKVITKAWREEPHAQLREALLKILKKYDNRQKFLSSAEKIAKIHPEHEESRLLVENLNNLES